MGLCDPQILQYIATYHSQQTVKNGFSHKIKRPEITALSSDTSKPPTKQHRANMSENGHFTMITKKL